MRISMPRGDIKWQRFIVHVPGGSPTNVDFTSVYFTVKKNPKDREYLFQKSLKRNEIYHIGPGDYELKIEPSDTENLAIGNYKFDIQIQYRNLLKETFVGDFILKEEITYPENEDEEEPGNDEPNIPEYTESSITIVEIPDYHIITLETPTTAVASSYNDLSDKPQIMNVTLQGNLSLEQLGIQPAGNYPYSPLTVTELDEILRED